MKGITRVNHRIPYSVWRETQLGLLRGGKDAIYTYHFYHLLQGARIFIYFTIRKVKVWSGEKSRFITQLEVEKQRNHNLTEI
jgi:hypothetical protein